MIIHRFRLAYCEEAMSSTGSRRANIRQMTTQPQKMQQKVFSTDIGSSEFL